MIDYLIVKFTIKVFTFILKIVSSKIKLPQIQEDTELLP